MLGPWTRGTAIGLARQLVADADEYGVDGVRVLEVRVVRAIPMRELRQSAPHASDVAHARGAVERTHTCAASVAGLPPRSLRGEAPGPDGARGTSLGP